MACITIDGKSLNVEDNKNLLECALENGIYIPHLCHHKDLSELGSCRLCIVEIEGEQGVAPSCMTRAKDGMKVTTDSERVKKLRSLALELLLAGHPEDCSTCPKYGNCELQTVIQYIGVNNARMRVRTKGFKENSENPLLIHDMNRCVLCGRCVRACNDLRGALILQYQKKGMETFVGALHDKLLKDAGCRFCGACAEVCPTGSIRDKLQLLNTDKKREEVLVPCKSACPAHTDIPSYIRFIKQGKYDEAAAVIREKLPFPKTLGMVCNHVCELQCKRKEVNEAMSIKNLKRYAAERDTGLYWKNKGKQLPDTGKKVCVVGGGPAGLSASYYLRKQGHEVHLKESLPVVGGMLRFGIPSYRLPNEVVAEEAKIIEDTGVKIETGAKIEKPLELLKEYDAVLMTIGAHAGVCLPMKGNDLKGVILNTDFLRSVRSGENIEIGKKVIILGGGNVAFDCARTAKRLGADEIHIACLESRENMTADDEEIEQASEEGILIHPAKTFECITGEDKVSGVDFMNVKSFTFDENRRAVIEKEEGSLQHIDADTVIFAVGQRPDITEESGLALRRGNCIVVKEESKSTEIQGVFAAGDSIYGTKSVVQAVQSGREAASEIDIYLGGDGDISEELAPRQDKEPYIGHVDEFGMLKRAEVIIKPANERKNNFEVADCGFTEEAACCEAERCLQCDLRLDITVPRLWTDYSDKKEGK